MKLINEQGNITRYVDSDGTVYEGVLKPIKRTKYSRPDKRNVSVLVRKSCDSTTDTCIGLGEVRAYVTFEELQRIIDTLTAIYDDYLFNGGHSDE